MASTRQRAIRIAIMADRRLFRDALATCLEARTDFCVVGHAATPGDLLTLCTLRQPDATILTLSTDIATLVDTVDSVRGRYPQMRLVVIYEELSPADLAVLWRIGVDTFAPISHGLDALIRLLRHRDAARAPTESTASAAEGLTDREMEIIALMSGGHSVCRIAELLQITTHAVENAKRRIYCKLKAGSHNQTVAKAAALGILGHPPTAAVPATEPERGLPELTARETDILHSIASGHTVRQTARLLGIAEKTVENTQARLFRKLGTRNRAGTLAAAHALGLVEAAPPPPPLPVRSGRQPVS